MAKIEDMAKNNVTMENQNNPETVEEKKPNFFKRAWTGIKTTVRSIKESPIAAAVGIAIGTAGTLGVQAFLAHRGSRHSDEIPVEMLLPEGDDDDMTVEEPAEEVEMDE